MTTINDSTILLMGGSDSTGKTYNDVWRSDDMGQSWHLELKEASWSPRVNAVAVSVGGITILTGGGGPGGASNDVWRSDDLGSSWREVIAVAPWLGRSAHMVSVVKQTLVLMAGFGAGLGLHGLNDVWISENLGETWTQRTARAPWAPRAGSASVALADKDVLIFGGGVYSGGIFCQDSNDVWRSSDLGLTWVQVTANASWPHRTWHKATVIPQAPDRIWLTGGHTWAPLSKPTACFGDWPNGPDLYYSDMWSSTDGGANWELEQASAHWQVRESHNVVAVNGTLVLAGGWCNSTEYNDVWRWE